MQMASTRSISKPRETSGSRSTDPSERHDRRGESGSSVNPAGDFHTWNYAMSISAAAGPAAAGGVCATIHSFRRAPLRFCTTMHWILRAPRRFPLCQFGRTVMYYYPFHSSRATICCGAGWQPAADCYRPAADSIMPQNGTRCGCRYAGRLSTAGVGNRLPRHA